MFGGNSNWRGPVWMPLNYLAIRQLVRFGDFVGDEVTVDYPDRLGRACARCHEVARDLVRSAPLDLAARTRRSAAPSTEGLGAAPSRIPRGSDNLLLLRVLPRRQRRRPRRHVTRTPHGRTDLDRVILQLPATAVTRWRGASSMEDAASIGDLEQFCSHHHHLRLGGPPLLASRESPRASNTSSRCGSCGATGRRSGHHLLGASEEEESRELLVALRHEPSPEPDAQSAQSALAHPIPVTAW